MLVGEVDELLDLYHEACNMVELYFLDEAHIPLNDNEKILQLTMLKHVLSCTCVVSLPLRQIIEVYDLEVLQVLGYVVCFIYYASPPVPCGNHASFCTNMSESQRKMTSNANLKC